ncbi:RNA polymerase sigma-54 factor [Treponema parvum]|uniref:RNA polymerase sigma-54 factor n=1 Tax=Treponema parvum TaxID=138851 RepID=A0A975F0Y0_9SPIR|nr:RNA polymerase sigma-54 factor [Treponema parvum]QTQ12441.1 RNA polymerase sigma-54 factor [Treponema parvum]
MPEAKFYQIQNASQIQTQKMSRQQIYSLNLLAMNSQDLRSEIYAAAEKNPALEIVKDPVLAEENVKKVSSGHSDYLRLGRASALGQSKADSFQEALESRPDERETLQEHLISQLNVSKISKDKYELSRKLIENLDNSGFHILAPISLLDPENPLHTEKFLDSCMDLVRRMDPIGTCCTGIPESLFVQASLKKNASPAVLFLLDGHFDFLDPPRPSSILKKIKEFVEKRKKMAFSSSDYEKKDYHPENFDIKDVEDALAFIKTLDPFPARQFGLSAGAYVVPDVYVYKVPVDILTEAGKRGDIDGGSDSTGSGANNACGNSGSGTEGGVQEKIGETAAGGIKSGEIGSAAYIESGAACNFGFRVELAENFIPSVAVSPGYMKIEPNIASKDDKKFIAASVREAKSFIENLEFRKQTIIKACNAIVRAQFDFFAKGPHFLAPLRQKDIAADIGVHEATVSRMANSKFIQCEWGLFPVKYFFTNALSTVPVAASSVAPLAVSDAAPYASAPSAKPAEKTFGAVFSSSSKADLDSAPAQKQAAVSSEKVKYEISKIIASQPPGAKPLSDQKLAVLLERSGIKIARRTVAKYRNQLNIESSYLR